MEDVRQIKKETALEKHFQTFLLSVITAAIIGAFVKMGNMSESLARIEERDKGKADQINAMQQSINNMQNDLNDLKERVTRFETGIE